MERRRRSTVARGTWRTWQPLLRSTWQHLLLQRPRMSCKRLLKMLCSRQSCQSQAILGRWCWGGIFITSSIFKAL